MAVHNSQQKRKPYYFYATGVSTDGKALTHGPFHTSLSAMHSLGDAQNVHVWRLRTSDSAKAAQMIRSEQMKATGSTESALQRQWHGKKRTAKLDEDIEAPPEGFAL